MFLLVGLGNPGSEYEDTRHNVGFMAVDALVRLYHFSPYTYQHKFHARVATGTLCNSKIMVLQSSHFMNMSGVSVAKVVNFYKIAPDNVIIIHDELDLPVGTVKVKVSGSTAGHRGLESLPAHILKCCVRVRIGIGHPGDRERVVDHVLGRFSKKDREYVEKILGAVGSNISCLLNRTYEDFTNKVATYM